ncbi:nucleotide pyrophosphohydrolase [Demequina subtropica]|uniref:nucleotide pyrophosphohydrolase n=1 Tax=Demequina subtropica TaxID=1638989 RepID=UPI000781EB8C|nr:nucleotide pyrophosphohydrolase [Demequina subtropica]
MANDDSMRALTAELREFARERDWEQFHDPKSLVLALMGEVGELAELLQWVPAPDAAAHFRDPVRHQRIGEELSDVLTYLLRLSDVLGVDLATAANSKLANSRERFRPEDFRGTAPLKD